MVKFGDLTLPHVRTIKQQHSTILQEILLPYRRFAYRKWLGGKGLIFDIGGYIMPEDDITPSVLRSRADGVPRSLDLESTELVRLESAQRYQTGPAWTDNTAEAKTPGGTPFTLLGATSDYYYFGHAEKFNQLVFDLQTLGDYGLIDWEYSLGDAGWSALADIYDDFLGSSLDLAKWEQLTGSSSVAGGILTLPTLSQVRSLETFGPFDVAAIFRISLPETDKRVYFYPFYISASEYIFLYFETNGHVYLFCNHGAGNGTLDLGAYDTNYHTYAVTWAPASVRVFQDGTLLGSITNPVYIPTAAGKWLIDTYQASPGTINVDYVKYLRDATDGFHQDEALSFDPPADWSIDSVHAITNKFWLRCKASSVTTPATVNEISIQMIFNCLMLDPSFTESAEEYNQTDYSMTFAQQENP